MLHANVSGYIMAEAKKTTTTTTPGSWDVTSFLTNAKTALSGWFALASAIIGVIVLFVGVWMIASGLMSNGKKQTNWIVAIICLIVGGALASTGGWQLVENIGEGGKKTIKDLGGDKTATTIIMMPDFEIHLPDKK